ncbi:pyrimidine-nucleoside phosphorylase [Rubeoparvulum massiliense]|uniref:pyrimidine-nucleoside phosphorylase n=1 Tax=Rubeoparvulum massiliense TaxID=1631346 RepID=UPI00065E8285|nr:pyrimidine-nucleoside phosphorylase [Rubeoparvulum massiliense]
MRMVDLIQKKRDGFALTKAELDFIIAGFTKGEIPDYQISAWAMAIYFKGMNHEEIAALTDAMVRSGDQVDLSAIAGLKVDKHSTGGVGDTTTLIVAPLVATVGVPVAKMSGRGLGHTGGTVDKLESFPGFKTELTTEQFIHNVNDFKLAVVGQSGNLTPADKKLYALRDVTATVDTIPLIASSIMSKKLASGADAIVLDVKTGTGAFMKTVDEAKELAETMVEIGRNLGRKTIAVISDMNQPLGDEVGNANEVQEAIATLQGKGPEDLNQLCLTLASHMTVAGGIYPDVKTAYAALEKVLHSGQALATFRRFIEAQGGDASFVDHPERLPQAKYHVEVVAPTSGYVAGIDAESVGVAAMLLGAGRKTKEDVIDHSVGITLKKKVGDAVQAGDVLAILHANREEVNESQKMLLDAYQFSPTSVQPNPMIHAIIQ